MGPDIYSYGDVEFWGHRLDLEGFGVVHVPPPPRPNHQPLRLVAVPSSTQLYSIGRLYPIPTPWRGAFAKRQCHSKAIAS